MKQVFVTLVALGSTLTLMAQQLTVNQNENAAFAANTDQTDNGVVSLAGRKGFSIQTQKGDFVFMPYMMIQTSGTYNYYADEGLDPAYNQDNVMNSGFAIPYAVLGFTGKAFDKVSFNLSINAAGSGGAILQQAWFDVKLADDALAIKTGKFKTPFQSGFLTILGGTLFPCVPVSMTSAVILPYALNSVNPKLMTGWDLGVEAHGLLFKKRLGYEVGIFNGTGGSVNSATKTLSDDLHIPSLLYAARLSYMPMGPMPAVQGDAKYLNENKLLFAVSANTNIESENESTNDTRFGAEAAWMYHRLYLSGEAYLMHMGFTDRMHLDGQTYDFWGAYGQAGFFVTKTLQLAARYDFFDRNGHDANGFLNMPAAGVNIFFPSCNMKLQAMYQYVGRFNHDTQVDRDNDDLGLARHSATVQLQYTF
ncbi:MAG: porin [Paludibacteraceae bacterium]|nr:porin [Paludibacteraceae bacterium]